MNDSHQQRVGTSAVIARSDKSILLVKRSFSDEFLPGIWELPGGGTELGEDPEVGVEREVKEECGLTVEVLYPVFTFTYMKEEKQIIDIAFLCRLSESKEVILSSEHEESIWVTLS